MGMIDSTTWARVEDALDNAVGMCWDGCHKIYISMDNADANEMRGWGYDIVDPDFDTLMEWWEDACGLRFITATHSVGADDNPNDGFVTLIPQFADDDEEAEAW
jgi:hypothetical protein